jgi:hypothetical protein
MPPLTVDTGIGETLRVFRAAPLDVDPIVPPAPQPDPHRRERVER